MIKRGWFVIALAAFSLTFLYGFLSREKADPTAHQNQLLLTSQTKLNEENSFELARDFVKKSPTYRFDGQDLQHQKTTKLDSGAFCWEYTFTFTSQHAGYGDRTGMMLAQMITPHTAAVKVENGEITQATLDNRYDMLSQELLK